MLAEKQLEARDDVDAAIGDAEHDKAAGWIGRVTRGDLGGESIQGETDLGLGNEGGGLGLGGHGGLRFAHRDGAGKARSGVGRLLLGILESRRRSQFSSDRGHVSFGTAEFHEVAIGENVAKDGEHTDPEAREIGIAVIPLS
jgi:hypothetical protein